jgi:hypothetical protein
MTNEIIEMFKKLNIPICDNWGRVRDLKDILQDLCNIWGKLAKDTKREVVSRLGMGQNWIDSNSLIIFVNTVEPNIIIKKR